MESTHKRTHSAKLLEIGFTEQQVDQLRARKIPGLLRLVSAQYDCFGVDENIFSAGVEGEEMSDTQDRKQRPISPEEYLKMIAARDNYEDIKEFINDCNTLYGEMFSKEQIIQLTTRSKDIFEAIAYNSVDLLMNGYAREVIFSRISVLTVLSIEAVARYSNVLSRNGMEREKILETAAEEDGHIHLQENCFQALSLS